MKRQAKNNNVYYKGFILYKEENAATYGAVRLATGDRLKEAKSMDDLKNKIDNM